MAGTSREPLGEFPFSVAHLTSVVASAVSQAINSQPREPAASGGGVAGVSINTISNSNHFPNQR